MGGIALKGDGNCSPLEGMLAMKRRHAFRGEGEAYGNGDVRVQDGGAGVAGRAQVVDFRGLDSREIGLDGHAWLSGGAGVGAGFYVRTPGMHHSAECFQLLLDFVDGLLGGYPVAGIAQVLGVVGHNFGGRLAIALSGVESFGAMWVCFERYEDLEERGRDEEDGLD